MAKYRKKPVVIEAVPVSSLKKEKETGFANSPNWVIDGFRDGTLATFDNNGFVNVKVHTLEGVMVANHEAMLIRGVSGELYPCESTIFQKTYEKVDDE